jgi:hypothetical protein
MNSGSWSWLIFVTCLVAKMNDIFLLVIYHGIFDEHKANMN